MWEEKWLSQFPLVEFKNGENIISTDEDVKFNYYIIKGICARTQITKDGEEIIYAYYHSGKMIGVNLSRYGYKSILDFKAKTDCLCYKIPYQLIQQKILEDNQLCYALLQEVLDELDFYIDASTSHHLGGGQSVLCFYLKHLATLQKDHTYLVPSTFTNIELSKYCGLHPVSVSRLLTKLTQEKILERTVSGIIIYDMERLTLYIKTGE